MAGWREEHTSSEFSLQVRRWVGEGTCTKKVLQPVGTDKVLMLIGTHDVLKLEMGSFKGEAMKTINHQLLGREGGKTEKELLCYEETRCHQACAKLT